MTSRLSLQIILCVIVTAFSAGALAQNGPRLAYAPADVPRLPPQPGAVARVAVAVGEAHRIDAAGRMHPLRSGGAVQAGDRVLTGADAMVMLVFVDDGRISLRADSDLLVRHYDIDPAGARTRIELELLRGTVRQISGNAARAQPDRYRLNTPIAVIGVRGTDFLARTSDNALEAFVHEGRIVLAPRDGACAAGDCSPLSLASSAGLGLQFVRLSAGGQVEFREFRPGELERVFGVDLARPARPAPAVAAVAAVDPPVAPRASEFQLPLDARLITDTIFVASRSGFERWSDVVEPVSAPEAAPSFEPMTPAVPVPAAPRQLVWGRFSRAAELPQVLPVPYEEASAGRHVTVGELGQYALWREGANGRLDRSLKGRADFRLAAAEALYVQPSGQTPASVTAASLRVDFDRSTFAAGVSVSHATAGPATLSVGGRVNDEGVFVGTTATDRVAGAVTRDGTEAGYLFSKSVNGGTFRGITLWGRP